MVACAGSNDSSTANMQLSVSSDPQGFVAGCFQSDQVNQEEKTATISHALSMGHLCFDQTDFFSSQNCNGDVFLPNSIGPNGSGEKVDACISLKSCTDNRDCLVQAPAVSMSDASPCFLTKGNGETTFDIDQETLYQELRDNLVVDGYGQKTNTEVNDEF